MIKIDKKYHKESLQKSPRPHVKADHQIHIQLRNILYNKKKKKKNQFNTMKSWFAHKKFLHFKFLVQCSMNVHRQNIPRVYYSMEIRIFKGIDRMHKWRPKKHSFVFVLIRPVSLVLKEHFFCILSVITRLVSQNSTKTEEHFFGRHLCNRSISPCIFFL